jgi:FAD/FMN-containing dehydrogenase
MLIDASRLQGVEIDAANKRAIVGPGCGGSVLVGALKKHGPLFPAGHCKGVCLGGYLLPGSFGWNSRALGMACESVIGLDVVMTDGSLAHASEEENADEGSALESVRPAPQPQPRLVIRA